MYLEKILCVHVSEVCLLIPAGPVGQSLSAGLVSKGELKPNQTGEVKQMLPVHCIQLIVISQLWVWVEPLYLTGQR